MLSKDTQNATALILTASMFFSTGCNNARNSFSSKELANSSTVKHISDKIPVIIKLCDNTLMSIIQRGDDIGFYKTSLGYAESGVEAHLYGSGVGFDSNLANIYNKLNPQEALAYFDGDWNALCNEVSDANSNYSNSVSPRLLKSILKQLVEPANPSVDGLRKKIKGMSYFITETVPRQKSVWDEREYPLYDTVVSKDKYVSDSVYIKLSDNSLLKVTEIEGEVHFYKTSEGYAPAGAKVTFLGFGGAIEWSSGLIYNEISAREAFVYLDKDPSKLIEQAIKQTEIFEHSVDPAKLKKALSK